MRNKIKNIYEKTTEFANFAKQFTKAQLVKGWRKTDIDKNNSALNINIP